MAGRRAAEGIALLAVYGGDEDDDAGSQGSGDEENEAEEEEGVPNEMEVGEQAEDFRRLSAADGVEVSASLREADGSSAGIPAPPGLSSSRASTSAGGLGIVDYGPEEGLALSPEPEDTDLGGESSGDDTGVQADDGPTQESPKDTVNQQPGTLSAQQTENSIEDIANQSAEAADVEDTSGRTTEGQDASAPDPMEMDELSDFLPPGPTEPCSSELQDKISFYLALRTSGKIFNENLRKSKGYRNPDFLQSAVRHYDIDHIGSCFRKEVFDPHGLDQADYHDSIAQEIRKEVDRKEQERRQSQRVDFVRSSLQATVTKPIVVPLGQKVVSVTTTEGQMIKTDGRASKKSKWDKVEVGVGRSSQAITHAADAIASISAHAALLTATANAGAGYASFAQQQRREAEKLRVNENSSNTAENSREKRKKLGS